MSGQDGSGPPPQALQPVPIGETVRAAYRSVFGQLDLVARTAFLPFLLSLLLVVTSNPVLNLLIGLLRLIPYTVFAVAWHRVVLLGPRQAFPAFFPGWSRRHWRFFGYALAVLAITFALISVISVAATAIMLRQEGPDTAVGMVQEAGSDAAGLYGAVLAAAFLGLPLVLYITMRFSFVFPAVAVDESYRMADAWRHTRGQGVRLVFVMFLTLAPMMTLELLLFRAMAAGIIGSAVAYVIGNVLGYISLALSLSVISSAFRNSTGWIPAAGAAEAPRDDGGDARS